MLACMCRLCFLCWDIGLDTGPGMVLHIFGQSVDPPFVQMFDTLAQDEDMTFASVLYVD